MLLGRLLAVAMGAAKLQYNSTADFEKAFVKYCNSLGLDPLGCSAKGMPILHQKSYEEKWNKDWDVWKGDICERLTVDHIEPIMNRQDQHQVTNNRSSFARVLEFLWAQASNAYGCGSKE